MIREPDTIIKCPNCGKFYITYDVLSYNTFGAKFYSDGRVISNMMSDHTKIVFSHWKLTSFITKIDHTKILNII